MSGKRLFHLLLITCLSVSVAFMTGCTPEEKTEVEHLKNEKEQTKEEFKDELSRKKSRIEDLEQELESKERQLNRAEFYSDVLLEMAQTEGVMAHEVLSEGKINELQHESNLWDGTLQVDVSENDKSKEKEFSSNGEITIDSSEFVLHFSGSIDPASNADFSAHGIGSFENWLYNLNDIEILDEEKVYDEEAASGATGFGIGYEFEDISDGSSIEIEITPEVKDYFELDTTNLIINVEK
ncbi:hypothetical protein [Natranaerofaba carboxydovora]|uniref:hypothetical protein n=1 Tax=Natranaerofaba carboxydovora TaxID=2742683 RepID=UPI001F13DF16|nr:hypothetical protein [Natranaerofaba carboxydovora]UMZ73528.1 hypothetical protein ACONDI_01082 [Natranaerofaba carboxydovora]UMZ75198.1 hypothetical protein ACONDI_02813 [Natranaerofaba carboxydovora]